MIETHEKFGSIVTLGEGLAPYTLAEEKTQLPLATQSSKEVEPYCFASAANDDEESVLNYPARYLDLVKMIAPQDTFSRSTPHLLQTEYSRFYKPVATDLSAVARQLDDLKIDIDNALQTQRLHLDFSRKNNIETAQKATSKQIQKSILSLMSEILPTVGLALVFIFTLLSISSFNSGKTVFFTSYFLIASATGYSTFLTYQVRSRIRREHSK